MVKRKAATTVKSSSKRKMAVTKQAKAAAKAEISEDKIEFEEKVEAEESSDDSDDEEDVEEVQEAPVKRNTKANRLAEMAQKAEKEPSEPKGVVYLGHLPKGFYEPQMKTFFGQFGTVTRIRLSRSRKNAASKGYAFIEFEEESVAQIVAETMDKYLLFEKQLVCHLVPREKQHPSMFKQWKRGIKNWSNQRRRKAQGAYNDRPKVDVDGESVPQVTLRQTARRNIKEKRLNLVLEGLGIKFDAAEASSGQRVSARKPKQSQEKERPKLPSVSASKTASDLSVVAQGLLPKKRNLESPPEGNRAIAKKKRRVAAR
jgi:nucleolar protein 15